MPFDTSIWETALVKTRKENESQRRELLAKALGLLDQLGPGFGIKQAYLFGSLVAPGRFGPELDIDIAVEQIDPQQFFAAMSKFATSLGWEVDLVGLQKCHFAHRIRERGILWQKRI